MELVVATRNKGKLSEIRDILKGLDVSIRSLDDYPDTPKIIEDGKTFLKNARKKASIVRSATGRWVLADDSGLQVEALNGEPGVKSARYAGRHGDYAANNNKLLNEMKDVPDGKREAVFVCAMVLYSPDGRTFEVEERCEGVIARNAKGQGGFGYDPIFYLPKCHSTMAELSLEEKNKISHRGKALKHIRQILQDVLKSDT